MKRATQWQEASMMLVLRRDVLIELHLTPSAAALTVILALVLFVAAGCASSPRAETAPASSVSPSAPAWAPRPWSPDFSHPPTAPSAHAASAQPTALPGPKRGGDDELLVRYGGAWKAMVAKRNGVGVADVDKGVSITRLWIDETAAGARFRVTYVASLDWAKAEGEDSFVVRVDSADPLAVRVPDLVGRWLSAAEVASFAERAPEAARLANVALGKHLKFDSDAAALLALAKLPGRRVEGGKPTYELATRGADRGHIRLCTNVYVGGDFCAAWVLDLVTAKSCKASRHSCAEDLDITDLPASDRSGPADHECAQP